MGIADGSARGLFAALLVLACLSGAATPASAACDGTVTCTGDISGGANYDGTSVTTLNANSLSVNITPGSGTSGLGLVTRADDGDNGHNGGIGIGTSPGDDGNTGNNLNLSYSQPGANPVVEQFRRDHHRQRRRHHRHVAGRQWRQGW